MLKNAIIDTVHGIKVIYGEVVELVYGTSLENWRRFVAYRGFESHPLRHFFNMETYPSGWRGQFAKLLGFVRAAEVQILSSPPKVLDIVLYQVFFLYNKKFLLNFYYIKILQSLLPLSFPYFIRELKSARKKVCKSHFSCT